MKQHITSDQWKEISEKQRDIMIDEWIFNHPLEVFSLPTIGQMIEFLGDDYIDSMVEFCDGYWETLKGEGSIKKPDDLCDALWEACVSVLNK